MIYGIKGRTSISIKQEIIYNPEQSSFSTVMQPEARLQRFKQIVIREMFHQLAGYSPFKSFY
ncbi:UNVERIFIED_CONTAM: hypothetical protein FKN15_025275 [Acipenser sinensis]